MKWRLAVVAAVVMILFMAFGVNAAYGQYRGSIQGTVTDAQGAVVPGATVTLTDKETNRTLVATTDDAGVYNIGGLPPSRYTLTIDKAGFKKKVLEDVGILAEQSNALNVKLDIGAASEVVTVNGDAAPQLDSETANVSGTVTAQQAQLMPSYGRDVFQLLQLAPGAYGDGSQAAGGGTNDLPSRNGPGGTGATTGVFATENAPAVSVGGSRYEITNYQIDGVGVTSASWGGTSIITPNEDSVKEIKIVTNGYDAEDGRYSAGQVKVITRNGTNQYHGSFFWRADRAGLNAFQKYNGPLNGVVRNTTKLNDFGGSFGGPIIRNKLFGFFSFETILTNGGATNQGWFETPSFRSAAPAGSVAALMMGFKGAAPLAGTQIDNTCADIGLSEGPDCHMIPGQGLDIGSPLTSALGTHDPTFIDNFTPGVGNGLDGLADLQFLSQSYEAPTTERQFNGRVDYNITNNDLLAFSFYVVPNSTTAPNGSIRGMNTMLTKTLNNLGTLIWDHTFSPSMQNEFRANAGGWRRNSLKQNPNAPFGLPTFAVQNLSGQSIGNTSPAGFGIGSPQLFDQWTYAGKDVLTKVHNSHTMKMGGEVTRLLFLDAAPWNARPAYNFNNMWDMLNDAPIQEGATFDPKTGVPSDFRTDTRETLYGFFFQDNYKLKPNLTITAGLRWEYFGPMSEKNGHLPVIQLGQGLDAISGLTLKTGGNLFQAQKSNFGPQLGFAWSPRQFRDKLVVRGGFGIGYTAVQEANTLDGRNNPPYLAGEFNLTGSQIVYGVNSLPASPTSFYGYGANPAAILNFDPNTGLPIPTADFSPVSVVAFQQHWPTTRTYRYSLDLQYDLGREWVASLGYQGTASRHLTRLYNYSLYQYAQAVAAGQPLAAFNPALQSVTMYDDGGRANFNALLAGIRHHFGHSFQLESQFRWAKSMDTGSNNYAPAQSGNCSCGSGVYEYTMNQDYAPSDYDVKYAFKTFGVWTPTIFHGERGWLEKIVGGWSLSGILNARTGYPWNPMDASMGGDAVFVSSGSAYGGGAPLRPGYYLGGLNVGNFKTQNYSNTALSIFPENNPSTGQPCYVAGPALSDIISGAQAPGPVPCAPGIGRNAFRGPGYFDIDATLSKSFGLPTTKLLGENARLEIRANFFNLFNKLNLTQVNTNVVDPHFGQAMSALGSRTIDLQARFSF